MIIIQIQINYLTSAHPGNDILTSCTNPIFKRLASILGVLREIHLLKIYKYNVYAIHR